MSEIKLAQPPWITGKERDLVDLNNDSDYTGNKNHDNSSNDMFSNAPTLTHGDRYDLGQTVMIPDDIQLEINEMTAEIDNFKLRLADLVSKIYRIKNEKSAMV